MVRAAPGAIEQILDNALDNALKVSPPGGVVNIAIEHTSSEVRLTIADQGPGLSDRDKDRAMRRFWRGDSSTAGTGLGLAIAAALATRSGGTLRLDDAAGGGLAVVLTLPAA
jgi:signal transduction histidine kinase